MSLWQEFIKEPIIFFSFTGMAILIAMFIYFGVFFFRKVAEAEKNESNS